MVISKRINKFRKLSCRNCKSHDVSATGSQQILVVHGRKRLAANIVCNECAHDWWSTARIALLLARQEDARRIAEAGKSGKKELRRIPASKNAVRRVNKKAQALLDKQKAQVVASSEK